MFSILAGIAQLGWNQNIDEFKEKLDPLIFDFIGFSMYFGFVFLAATIVLAYVFLASPQKGEVNATPTMD